MIRKRKRENTKEREVRKVHKSGVEWIRGKARKGKMTIEERKRKTQEQKRKIEEKNREKREKRKSNERSALENYTIKLYSPLICSEM